MLDKILIKMIMKELLRRVFFTTFIFSTFEVKQNINDYDIEISAYYNARNITIIKKRNIHPHNWISLILDFDSYKKELEESLVENIKKEEI